MKALRLILNQNQACYRKAETVDNKMTYPLPPYSTVIGALHKACGYREYRPMDISIQGSFGAMQREPYTDHAFLDNTQDDRGLLVKLHHGELLSKGYEVVAKAKKNQGNSFEKEKTINVMNRELLQEYQDLKRAGQAWGNDFENAVYHYDAEPCQFIADHLKAKEGEESRITLLFHDPDILRQVERVRHLRGEVFAKDAIIKKKKALLASLTKESPEHIALKTEINQIKGEKKEIDADWKEAKTPIEERLNRFATLTTSLKYYEVLYDVRLVIHIAAEDNVLQDIAEHIHSLTAIGRSEDFVEVKSCEMVELSNDISEEINSTMSAYISMAAIKSDVIDAYEFDAVFALGGKLSANGTKYLLNKDYHIEDKQRIFHKVPVLYTSNYSIGGDFNGNQEQSYVDKDHYIVSFV